MNAQSITLLCLKLALTGLLWSITPLTAMQPDPHGTSNIFHAVETRSLEGVMHWVNQGVDINAPDHNGKTALIQATRSKYTFDIFTYLLEQPTIDLDKTDRDGNTAFMYAMFNPERNEAQLKMLANQGADLTILYSEDKMTPLIWFAKGYAKNSTAMMRWLLEHHHDRVAIDAQDKFGHTALMTAAVKEDTDALACLLEHKANINQANIHRLTALNIAIEVKNAPAISLLLAAGATVQDKDLIAAIEQHNAPLVKQLLAHGASKDAKNKFGRSASMVALNHNQFDIAELFITKQADWDHLLTQAIDQCVPTKIAWLLTRGANPNAVDSHGRSALVAALNKQDPTTLTLLLNANADIEAQNGHGQTALMHAARRCKPEFITLLLHQNPNVDKKDSQGYTALMHAASENTSEVIAQLLHAGASPTLVNEHGITALEIAIRRGNIQGAQLLLPHTKHLNQHALLPMAAQTNQYSLIKWLLDDLHISINSTDDQRNTALMMACTGREGYDLVEYLLEQNADLGLTNKDGHTALSLALYGGNTNIADLLLTYQKTIDQNTITAITHHPTTMALLWLAARGVMIDPTEALLHAANNGNPETCQFLLNNGANIEATNALKETPFIIAAKQGNWKAAQLFLQHNANRNATDSNGLTALDWAVKKNHPTIIALLAERVNTITTPVDHAIRRMHQIHGAVSPKQPVTANEMEEEEEKKETEEKKIEQQTPSWQHIKALKSKIQQQCGANILDDHIVKDFLEIDRLAIANGDFVLIRATRGDEGALHILFEELFRLLMLHDEHFKHFIQNRFFTKGALEETIFDYLRYGIDRYRNDAGDTNVVLSANLALFGNLHNKGSFSWDYFTRNINAQTINTAELLASIFDTYGFDKQYINEFLTIAQPIADRGLLQQIVIPRPLIDDVVVLSDIGYCPPYTRSIDGVTREELGWNEELQCYTKISVLLDKYADGSLTKTKSQTEKTDELQARMILNHKTLDPKSGIKYHYHFRHSQAMFNQVKNQIKALAHKIFEPWLAQQIQSRTLSDNAPVMPSLTQHKLGTVLGYLGNSNFKQHVREGLQSVVAPPASALVGVTGDPDRLRALFARDQAANMQPIKQPQQQHLSPTLWQHYAQQMQPNNTEKLFIQDCDYAQHNNACIPTSVVAEAMPDTKDSNLVRLATYNVHNWRDALGRDSIDAILAAIASINADIIVLQEADASQDIKDRLVQMGYMHQISCPKNTNMIISKYPFAHTLTQNYKDGQRSFINVQVKLPDGTVLSVYGTHLDVYDETGKKRLAEVQELMRIVAEDPNTNKVLLGDWNAVREQDYTRLREDGTYEPLQEAGTPIWDLLTKDFISRTKSRHRDLNAIPTDALEHIAAHGFIDSFTQAEISAQQYHDAYYAPEERRKIRYPRPTYTVWTARVVDFIFCKIDPALSVLGSYVYYGDASDHLPVITDFALRTSFA